MKLNFHFELLNTFWNRLKQFFKREEEQTFQEPRLCYFMLLNGEELIGLASQIREGEIFMTLPAKVAHIPEENGVRTVIQGWAVERMDYVTIYAQSIAMEMFIPGKLRQAYLRYCDFFTKKRPKQRQVRKINQPATGENGERILH